jgi:hypothetical protein
VNTVLREGCGTYLGLKLHLANGEPPCSECLRNEAYRRVEHEGIPSRLPHPDALAPVSAAEAERNLKVLAEALAEDARERRRSHAA